MDIILQYFSDFTETQLAQFGALQKLYSDWNEKINVISRKDIESLYERHVLHSLAIAAAANFNDGCEIVDIGTGGGFPGIPLAIFFPNVRFLLADSIGKKLKVVEDIAAAIGLKNVEVRHTRVEDIKDRKFDFAVSRAVAPLGDLWKWAKPILRTGHQSEEYGNGLICLKGGDLSQEFAESGLRPRMLPVNMLFDEPGFDEKYVVYVPR
ncbi:16S rRNA (guanine(527)-N(7))-methyltransferase RsmG [Rurimicrobium arvi]|uniref:Ribosomal RNA small subunit methyltransferase G n=1 Tax=Rurimicrobium arvi TaxID=2049916 RepID=A0ABP8MTU0_9BACT